MPRVRPHESRAALPPVDDDAMRIQNALGAISAHRPEVSVATGALNRAIVTSGTLSPRLRELIRLRIAFHNQCRSCMAMRYSDAVESGLNEDLVCSLQRPEEAEGPTPAERPALRFAAPFATHHLAIDDSVYDHLPQYF